MIVNRCFVALTACVVACFSFGSDYALASDCDPSRVDLRGDWGQASFSVEVADTASERSLGLMNRESMATSHGMLFVYDTPQSVSFWMKDTLIALDMLFLTADGRVARIHHGAVPLDLTPIHGGDDISLVLEINGGLSKRFRISEGSEMRSPLLDQAVSAWPCEAAQQAH